MQAKTKSIRLTSREMAELLEGIPDPDLHAKISAQLDGQTLEPERGPLAEGREHLTAAGLFRSDKYPWSRDGFVPLKVTDEMAWPMLRAYAAAREGKDLEFTRDLDEALDKVGAPSMSHFLTQREEADGSPRAIADMMTALVGTLDQMDDLNGLNPSDPRVQEIRIRKKNLEGEVLRLSRKVE